MEQDQQLEQFVDRFNQIFRYMKRNQWGEPDTNAITRTQWSILRTLWQQERCSIGQLAEWLEVRPSTMSQMIDRLELAGLVSRETDKRDARARVVQLTENGRDTIRKLNHVRVKLLAEPFGRLSEQEQQTLVLLMTKLAQQLSNPSGTLSD